MVLLRLMLDPVASVVGTVFRLTRPEAGHSGPEPLAHYTSDLVAASGSGYPAPSREDVPLHTGERDNR